MVITRTPFRMSFLGGGSDFPDFYRTHGGCVLSATFDKYCYVTLRRLPGFFDYKNEFVYSKIERVNSLADTAHPAIREALLWQGLDGVRINYEADLPARSGLGTSSSFAVGLLHAIHALRGEPTDAAALAGEAIHLERDLCREAGGVQDQIAAAFGGFNKIELSENGFTVTPVEISKTRKAQLSGSLMLFFTGISRYSAALQDAHQAALDKKTDDLLAMKNMAYVAERVLKSGDLDDFGHMLDEAWQRKRSITDRISNAGIDALYEKAMAAGAFGGKLLGAGGGGFLLFYVSEERQSTVRAALEGLLEVPFAFEDTGSTVIFKN